MSSNLESAIEQAFRQAAIRRLRDEFLPKLAKAVDLLSEEEIWRAANEHTNSVGNLLLHLEGNVRQWIVSGLGGEPDTRQRQLEFTTDERVPKALLMNRLEATVAAAVDVIQTTSAATLAEEGDFQGFRETGVGAILHVVEHFSYHLGQIAHMVKAEKSVDLKYYQGHDLNHRNQ